MMIELKKHFNLIFIARKNIKIIINDNDYDT